MNNEQFIDHEVRIRVLKEAMRTEFELSHKSSDDKFNIMQKNSDDKFAASRIELELIVQNINDKLDNRFKSLWSLGLLIMGLLTPVFLKSIGVI